MNTLAWVIDYPDRRGRRVYALHDTTLMIVEPSGRDGVVYQFAYESRENAERYAVDVAKAADLHGWPLLVPPTPLTLSPAALGDLKPTHEGTFWAVPVLFGELMAVLP